MKEFEKAKELIVEAQNVISPLRVGIEDIINYRGREKVYVNGNGQIIVKLGRGPDSREREYLTDKGFKFEQEGSLWWKPDDGCAGEIRAHLGVDDMGDSLVEKVELSEKIAKVQERLESRASAGEVFADFSVEAARLKVTEMYIAKESSERQRAQETVLAYALGKPVERVASVNVQIANMDIEEIRSKIREKLNLFGPEVGIEGTVGRSSALIVEDGGSEGGDSVKGV